MRAEYETTKKNDDARIGIHITDDGNAITIVDTENNEITLHPHDYDIAASGIAIMRAAQLADKISTGWGGLL